MKMFRLVLIVFWVSFSYPQISFVDIDEELQYSANFRFINAGEANLRAKYFKDNKVQISTTINSNRFLSRFYAINDSINSIYTHDFKLDRIFKKISQGDYQKTFVSSIDSRNREVKTNSNIDRFRYDIYDPIGLIYLLRSVDIKNISNMRFSIIDNGKVMDIGIDVYFNHTIVVAGSEFSCVKFVPYSIRDEKLFKNEGIMSVWITDDEDRVPIKIEQLTNIGTMTLELKGRTTR